MAISISVNRLSFSLSNSDALKSKIVRPLMNFAIHIRLAVETKNLKVRLEWHWFPVGALKISRVMDVR